MFKLPRPVVFIKDYLLSSIYNFITVFIYIFQFLLIIPYRQKSTGVDTAARTQVRHVVSYRLEIIFHPPPSHFRQGRGGFARITFTNRSEARRRAPAASYTDVCTRPHRLSPIIQKAKC